MKRTYLAITGLAAAVASPVLLPALGNAGVFDSRPLDAERFAVLARPVGQDDWKLLVLEQVRASPRCWESRSDGLVDPALNRFDFSGICSRYLDSNGYSLRVDDEDLASRYRLSVQQVGSRLQLLATSSRDSTAMLVGQAEVPRRDRDGFVEIRLEQGWQLERRVYGERTLGHVYFANGTPLAQLTAPPKRDTYQPGSGLDAALAGLTSGATQQSGPASESSLADSTVAEARSVLPPGRTIALQVIPYRE